MTLNWSTTTTEKGANLADFAPTQPGEILAEEFLEPLGITAYRLAKEIEYRRRG